MHVTRFQEAKPYEAPNHRGVVGLRLQGFHENGPKNQWVGYSQFLPGGGAGPDSTPFEKVYLVLEVEMTVIAGRREVVLGLMDSCALAPGEMCEMCEIVNRGNNVAKMVVVMPYPEVPA